MKHYLLLGKIHQLPQFEERFRHKVSTIDVLIEIFLILTQLQQKRLCSRQDVVPNFLKVTAFLILDLAILKVQSLAYHTCAQ